ncbi:hypothetical protein [Planctomicrobium sp. SH527]|uniref:hypothetical protein n=1 Tax=Planctomicrobium sp. SH527 TaxID=3448123 RepID=UPI003F5BA25C
MIDDRKAQISEVAAALQSLSSIPYPSLGIDLDGCVDECPIFFQLLTGCWPGKVFVISYRNNREKTIADLEKQGIRYDELILVDSFEAKAKVIEQKGILVYFDDQPEMLKGVSSMVNVMLVRNGGNFDFKDQRWMLSKKTGKIV